MRRTVPAQPLNLPTAIYARFSSHKQDEESIEQQVAECKQFAATRGLNVIEVYSDAAISGRSDRRPQFQRLKRDADKGKFAAIIAYKSSRIARNLMNALNFEYEMQQRSIAVYYAKEEYGDDATGKFMRNIMMATNQFHSDNMGEDIRNGMDNIGDDIQNGIDNVEDGIQNGIDDMRDGSQDNGGDMNNRGTRTSRLEEASKNLVDSVREASAAIRDGLMELSQMR